jgi:hypothetical protein
MKSTPLNFNYSFKSLNGETLQEANTLFIGWKPSISWGRANKGIAVTSGNFAEL